MKKLRLFFTVVKRCKADKITIGLIISFFAVSLIIMYVEPQINSYGDALWFTFTSTAIFSGVIVTVYLEVIERTAKETTTQFIDKLEHLSELDKSELKELENKVVEIRKKYN